MKKQTQIRLSEKQKEVIRLMRDGWELGRYDRQMNASRPLPSKFRVQEGGLGKGGKTISYNEKTGFILWQYRLIATDDNRKFYLTTKGKSIQL